MPVKQIKNSFNAGELSQYMDGRTDINKYYNGCSKGINAIVLPHGGVTKRPGTEWMGKAPNKCNLFAFVFSVSDALILEFSNLLIRFYKNGDRVYEDDIEIASTTEDDPVVVTTDAAHGLANNEWVYLEDIDTATSLNDKIYQITVTGATTFTLQDTEGNDIDGTGIGVGGALGSCKRIYQRVSPYTSAQAFQIHTTQSADVMYIAHEDVHPKKLSRTADTSWTITDVNFKGGPFLDENTTSAYLMGFARTGGTVRAGYYFPAGATGTLTATGGHTPFLGTANDVGTLWLVKHARPDNKITTFDSDDNSAPTDLTNAIKIKGDFNVTFEPIATTKEAKLWRKEGNADWQEYRSFRYATMYSGTEYEDDVYYCMSRSDNTIGGTLVAENQYNRGVVKVTTHSTTTVANVIVIDPVLSDNATDNAVTTSTWAEGAWGLYRGYPRTVTFFEDRLWWASSTNDPDTMWSSKSGDYENMECSDLGLDDEAIIAPLKDNEVSQIQWMQARQTMAVGAANKEYRFGASNPEDPVTPSDRKAVPQTGFSSDDIQPVVLNDTIFFLQMHGKRLGAMKFDAIAENFDVRDATLLAYGIFNSAPTCMAVQRIPDSIVWVSRTDGVLLPFVYKPEEEIAGWTRCITQNTVSAETPVGFYESVAVIHGSTEDEIWVSVRRIINSVTVRYIERFGTRHFDQVDEALMLDCAKVVDPDYTAKDIVLACDTIRYDDGLYGSGLYGGLVF
jgi:hypothetical protein